MTSKKTHREPDFAAACEWWPDLPNIWTPLGWRDHLCRFNVLWNGTVLAQPHMNRRTVQWADQGLQMEVLPSRDGTQPNEWTLGEGSRLVDDGMVRQGWLDDDAPVLWTEWMQDGLLLRAAMLAHLGGGRAVQRGDEPLFLWARLGVHDVCRTLRPDRDHGFLLLLHACHVRASMSFRHFRFLPGVHVYPRPLRADTDAPGINGAWRVVEPDGRVRLAVAAGKDRGAVRFFEADDRPPRLHVALPARRNAHCDILVPMLPCDRDAFNRELSLGFDAARLETRRFWRHQLRTPTRFKTPEPDINDALRQSVRFSLNLTERNPATGKYVKVNGSWIYADLWATPGAMDLIMLLDTLGYHDAASRYLEVFREEQGTVVPPGKAYELHPGYLSTPALYKSCDWLSDNGALLWTICRHVLLSGDAAFAGRFTDCIVKSCDWIQTMRAKTGHGGYEGVLPPAVATDYSSHIQAIWSAGWNYLGLCAAVRVLKRIGHPQVAEFAAEADDYRRAYVKALRHKCRTMPTWKDTRGRRRRFVPTALAGDVPAESRHAFYLDTGPLFNVFAGLLPADDPLMCDALAWFRDGPLRPWFRHDSNCWQTPLLDREMSSCEPCYSWNIFHSWQTGDKAKFLEGLYSLFAGSMSRKTRTSCETRGGITGTVFSASLAVYAARLALIDDQLRDGELHLLRLVPAAWLRPGANTVCENVPTEYGPVSVTAKMSRDGGLEVTCGGGRRAPPDRVELHIPRRPDLRRMRVNGVPVDTRRTRVRLNPGPDGVWKPVRTAEAESIAQ